MKHKTVAEILASITLDEQIITKPVPKGLRSNTPPPKPRVVNYPIEESWDRAGADLVILGAIMLAIVFIMLAVITMKTDILL